MMDSITGDIEVEDFVAQYPDLVPLLTDKGIICIQCGAPIWGTLSEVIERAGFDVDAVLTELNRRLNR